MSKFSSFCAIAAFVQTAVLWGDDPGYRDLIAFQGDSPSGSSPSQTPALAPDGYLYGETTAGGPDHGGVVYKIKPDGTGYTVIHSSASGGTGLLPASDGFLYGIGPGTGVFKLAEDGSSFVTLRTLNSATGEGSDPRSRLIEGADGFLYGTTAGGGANRAGTVFKLDKTGSNFAVLYSFSLSNGDGRQPEAGLVMGKNGVLYGATYSGGALGYGTVYSLNSDGSNYQILYSFHGNGDGQYPVGTPIIGSDGQLFGTTYQNGGPYSLSITGGNFHLLRSFSYATEGSYFSTGLIQGTDGALYGRSFAAAGQSVGGTLFKLQRDGTGYQALYAFPALSGALTSSSGVIQVDASGILSMDSFGGVGGVGTLIRVPFTGGTKSVVYDFGVAFTGIHPTALVAGADGRLYGATGSGTIFSVNRDGTGFASIAFLTSNSSYEPSALIAGSGGYLYGTTQVGGSANLGTIFRLKTDGSQYAVIHSLSASEASGPVGLIQGPDGVLYVALTAGGSAGLGAIAKMNAGGSGFILIHTFTFLTPDGRTPLAAPILASDGVLYGTASFGGSGGGGIVYRLNTDGSQFAVLRSFAASTNGQPAAPLKLIEGNDGALYGFMFRLQKDGGQFSLIGQFDGQTSFSTSITSNYLPVTDPSGYYASNFRNLIQGSDGGFYFTGVVKGYSLLPQRGPQSQRGGVFRVNADGTGFGLVAALDSNPLEGAVILATDGALYGATSGAIGTYALADIAVIFRANITPVAPSLTTSPSSQHAAVGQTLTLTAAVAGTNPMTFAWTKNGVPIAGATASTLTLGPLQLSDAGSYICTATNGAGTVSTVAATLTVTPPGPVISTQPSSQALSCGGSATLSVAAGAAVTYQWQLNHVNIPGATSANYSLTAVSTLQAGTYTVVITGQNGVSTTSTPAVVTVAGDARPLNISTRAFAGSGSNALVAGFIIAGTTSETVLIRGAGPALSAFQVEGSLANPQLTLFDSTGKELATNTGWGGSPTLSLAFARVYAFPFAGGSADCAMVMTLPPGSYSAQVTGVNGTTGIALIEVYDVPVD